MGVVEAGMILGLTAAGVSEADATAAVFIQRLFTSYLPPIWGWLTLVWMRQRSTCKRSLLVPHGLAWRVTRARSCAARGWASTTR